VVLIRAQYFITCNDLPSALRYWEPERLKSHIISESHSKYKKAGDTQLSLFSFAPIQKAPALQVHYKS
jgi:hypothetical protein